MMRDVPCEIKLLLLSIVCSAFFAGLWDFSAFAALVFQHWRRFRLEIDSGELIFVSTLVITLGLCVQ